MYFDILKRKQHSKALNKTLLLFQFGQILLIEYAL